MNAKKIILNCGCLLLSATSVFATKKTKEKPTRPNIIYILADDLGYGDVGCYGQKTIKTPNIDKLAEEGMMFTQHYAGSTVCAPSRGTLMTGLHTGHAFIRANGKHQLRHDPYDITVAKFLKDAGYDTAMIGKASTGCSTTPGQVNKKGFDHFFGYLDHAQAHSYFPKFLHRDSVKIEFPGNGGNNTWEGDTYSHDLFVEDAVSFIEKERKNKPFFLFYASALPHAQLYAPEKFKTDYKGKFSEKPFSARHYGTCEDPNATTAGMIARLDWEIGEILKTLKKEGLDKNTIIMFSSDNGPHSAGGRKAEFFNSSGPFRGIKRDLYEGGIRVPFIVRWPGVVKKGSESDHISAFWDLLPTLTEIAKAKTPAKIDGISFLPTLRGKRKRQKEHDHLYWEFFGKGGKQAVRKGEWKAVRIGLQKNPNASIELYNLTTDPAETKDISARHPEIVKEMARLMRNSRTIPKGDPLYRSKKTKGKKQIK
ncbi:arylsulfatase [Fulvitalea axinellae]|uniref:Arylsulfatase n=1 Tax=Fulvitalea axinellae TaxID=1182444 RepID=A0AAU9CSK8_9BACT|nr:arylsulfatase [Fulvitalea axinellae]